MAQNKTKMLFAIILSTVSIFLVIGLEIFYLAVVDQKVVASSKNTSLDSKVIGAILKNEVSDGIDLSQSLKLEYATDSQQRAMGLMHRDVLCVDCGMLFVFENPGYLSFWMKNTLIPLDITFISADGTIINTEAATPEPSTKDDSQLPTYKAKKPALYVLETNQGWIQKNGLKDGDKLDMSKILPKK